MIALRRRHTLRRPGMAWLLWLALFLPLAQTAAFAHAAAHGAATRAAGDDDRALAHAAHCDLCLAAAALGSGAPAPVHAAVVLQSPSQVLAGLAAESAPAAAGARPYQSRAPPAASR